jgi:hypothetical protein
MHGRGDEDVNQSQVGKGVAEVLDAELAAFGSAPQQKGAGSSVPARRGGASEQASCARGKAFDSSQDFGLVIAFVLD